MNIKAILKKYWNYDSFRPMQEDIINSVLGGHDTLGLLPTGGGKSITFQIPGLAFENGVTIVVTPLISLMKDQVDNLRRHKIQAVYFHSDMGTRERRVAWEKVTNGKVRFIYVSPERLGNERFMLEIRNLNVCLIVVDEAHCISQWGYDFRPSYLNISSLRKIKPMVPILALTATATPEVAKDICRLLEFRDYQIFKKSFVRDNISYIVRPSESKIAEILNILQKTHGSAIVYVRSRKRTRDIAEYLTSAGIIATHYHAGLDFSIKEERQNQWKSGIIRVIVATNAFGMGIDKPDVRLVIHYDPPPSLEEYYQEAGRAGRDGKNAYAVLLVAKTDKSLLTRHVNETFPKREIIKLTYERICNYLHISVGEGFESIRQFNIEKFCELFKLQEKQCRASIKLLSQAGYLHYNEDPDSRSRVMMLCTREDLYCLQEISKNVESVLTRLLRLYTGLFTDYVFINETEIANSLGIEEHLVYEAMLELSRKKLIHYIPHSKVPTIFFPTSREETHALIIGKSIYEERKRAMENRIKHMVTYSFGNDSCRVRDMLRYFGETEAEECGKCDICRAQKQKTLTRKEIEKNELTLTDTIIACLQKHRHGMTLNGVVDKCGCDRSRVSKILNFLCNEGFVKCENRIYCLTN